MNKFKFTKNSKGFTIPEVMVAAGIMGIISVGVLSITKNLNKVSRFANQSSNINSLRTTLYSVMRKNDACMATFNGKVVNGPLTFGAGDGVSDGANIVIQKGAVFGDPGLTNASSRITIQDVKIEAYTPIGAPYKNDPTDAANNRQQSKSELVIIYQRGDWQNIANSEAQERDKTLGSINNELRVPVQLVHDLAGNFVGCNTESSAYAKAMCDSLQGEMDTDGYCRHITIEDDVAPNNDFASRFRGNVIVTASNTDASKNDLRVDGSVGIGRDPVEGASAGGYLAVQNSMALGPSATVAPPNEGAFNEPGVLHVNNSVGIGVAPNALKGSLAVNRSAAIGSGAAVPAGDGDLSVQTSLGVGIAPTGVVGQAYVQTSVGVGQVPFANAGSIRARGVAIDAASTLTYPGDGNMVVSGYIHLPNQAETTANTPTHAATMGWVARKISQTITPASLATANAIYTDILQANPDDAAFTNICRGMWVQGGDGVYYQGVYNAGRCEFDIRHCSEKNGSTPVCNVVYAGAGGVESDGKILAKTGNITAQTGNIVASAAGAQITALNGSVIGNNVTANTSLCLAGFCKNSWEQINIETSTCTSVSASSSCGSGYFIRRVTLVKENVTYVTSVTPQWYFDRVTAVTAPTSTKSITTDLNYECCRAVNVNP